MNSINPQNQLTDILGITIPDNQKTYEKIEQVKANINNITHVNGSKVFNVEVKENDIYYNLKKRTDGKIIYYYPIQYAEIKLK